MQRILKRGGEYTPGTKAQSVEDVRTETVAQMSATCNAAIVGGVDVTLTGGETKHFSLTLEDQLNLLSLQGACGLWGR